MQQYYLPSNNPPYDSYVEFVQRELNNVRLSLLHDMPLISPVDGKYGFQTANTVKVFQRHCGIKEDGIWGPKSRKELAQKMREKPFMSTAPQKIKMSSLPNIISIIADILKNGSDQAVTEVERVAAMGNALTTRSIPEISQRIVRNNAAIRDIQKAVNALWSKQDEVMAFLMKESNKPVFLELRRKGISVKSINQSRDVFFAKQNLKNMNNSPAVKRANECLQKLIKEYVKRMQSADFLGKIQQKVNSIPKVGKTIKVGNVFKGLAFVPLGVDLIAIFFFAINDLPIEDLMDQTFKDLCSFIEGVIISAVVGSVVLFLGISGGVAIAVVLVVSVIIAIICEIFDVHILYDALSAIGKSTIEMEQKTNNIVVGPKYI